MAKPRHHYLPATFLAGFSEEATLPRRKRRLVQGDKKTRSCCTAPAERLAVIRDMYTLRDPRMYTLGDSPENFESNSIDNCWAGYESRLAECIKRLTLGTLDALEWAGVLVPFVASLFARGDDFRRRFEARFGDPSLSELSARFPVDNVNQMRGMEIQRTLGPILAARWIVSKVPEGKELITTDLAFGFF